MDDQTYRWLEEVLRDAAKCPRLTPWEVQFTDDIRERHRVHGPRLHLTENQLTVLKRIESEKLYV